MNLSRPVFWQTRNIKSWGLYPLSLLFRFIASTRRSYKLRNSWVSPVPVIVVGNISVGGAGKTPLVIALCDLLTQRSLKVGIVTRGYGGDSVLQPAVVDTKSKAKAVGDEAVLLAQRCKGPVVACADRVKAVQYLLTLGQFDCILSDDGMQHYALHRDLEIAVVDSHYKFGNGFCLPAGPLREPVARLDTVDMVVHSGNASGYILHGTDLVCLNDANKKRSIESLGGAKVHAVAGIAAPYRFFEFLRAQGLQVVEHPHADHAAYQPSDFRFDDDLPIVMTEKDMVKCGDFELSNSWYVPVTAVLGDTVVEEFNRHIDNLCSERH